MFKFWLLFTFLDNNKTITTTTTSVANVSSSLSKLAELEAFASSFLIVMDVDVEASQYLPSES